MSFGIDDAIANVSRLVDDAINKIWPSPEEKAKAEVMLLQANLETMKLQMSVMLQEASSSDPWTSRARPSFLYVVYTIILFGIPIGILSAFHPDMATNIGVGFGGWLKAIPDQIVDLFKWVMLGYVGARTVDKSDLLNNIKIGGKK